jgi:uncharacterized coiled-coil protein SlyX
MKLTNTAHTQTEQASHDLQARLKDLETRNILLQTFQQKVEGLSDVLHEYSRRLRRLIQSLKEQ